MNRKNSLLASLWSRLSGWKQTFSCMSSNYFAKCPLLVAATTTLSTCYMLSLARWPAADAQNGHLQCWGTSGQCNSSQHTTASLLSHVCERDGLASKVQIEVWPSHNFKQKTGSWCVWPRCSMFQSMPCSIARIKSLRNLQWKMEKERIA